MTFTVQVQPSLGGAAIHRRDQADDPAHGARDARSRAPGGAARRPEEPGEGRGSQHPGHRQPRHRGGDGGGRRASAHRGTGAARCRLRVVRRWAPARRRVDAGHADILAGTPVAGVRSNDELVRATDAVPATVTQMQETGQAYGSDPIVILTLQVQAPSGAYPVQGGYRVPLDRRSRLMPGGRGAHHPDPPTRRPSASTGAPSLARAARRPIPRHR